MKSFNRRRAFNLINSFDRLSKLENETGLVAIEKLLINASKSTNRDWHKVFRQLARVVRGVYTGEYGTELADGKIPALPFNAFIMNGNSKLPFVTWSTLPIITCPGAGECRNWCYSLKSWRYPAAFARQLMNTILLRHCPEFIKALFYQIPKDVTLRLYVDGDFESMSQAKLWWRLLNSRPDIKAYGYSKSWDILSDAYDDSVFFGLPIPSNYKLNLSSGVAGQFRTKEYMSSLPFVRGEFLAVKIDAELMVKTRFSLPEYHKAVRDSIKEQTGKPGFSCPGQCGDCSIGGTQACGSGKESFQDVTIAIGIH